MTYAMLLQILIEAEARRNDVTLPADVRERSRETISLCNQRMTMEGLTRVQIEGLAK